MEKYRIGNDIKVKWVIFRNGKKPEDFTKATIQELRLNNVTSGDSLLPTYSVSGNVITVEYPASQQKEAGVFTLTLKYTKKLSSTSTEDQYTIDKENAFEIVAQTRFEESDPEIPGVIESFVYRNRDGKDGSTPDIGKNENWWIDGKDTGKPSRGRKFESSDFTEAEWNEIKKPSLDAAGIATDAAIRCEDAIIATNDVKASTIVVRDETSRVKLETNAVKLATEEIKNQTDASKAKCDEATTQSITHTGNAQKATAETIKSSIIAVDAASKFDNAITQEYPTTEPTTKATVINAQDTFKKFKEQEGKMVQLEQDVNEKADIVSGKNKFSGNNWQNGKFISWIDGTVKDSATYNACIDYVAILPSTTYAVTKVSHIAYYDINKIFISGSNSVGIVITTPANARYVRIDNTSNSDYNIQIELGNQQTSYEKYYTNIPDSQISSYILNSVAKSNNNIDNNFTTISVNNNNGRCTSVDYWAGSAGIALTYNQGIVADMIYDGVRHPSIAQNFTAKNETYKFVFKANISNVNGNSTLKIRGAAYKDVQITANGEVYIEEDVTLTSGDKYIYVMISPTTQQAGTVLCNLTLQKFAYVGNSSGMASGKILDDCINIGDVNIPKYCSINYSINGKIWGTIGDSLTAQGMYIKPLLDKFRVIRSDSSQGGKTMSGNSNADNPCMWEDSVINKIDTNASVITIMGGTNDWAQSKPIGNIDDTDVTTFAGALNTALSKLLTRYPVAKIVVIAPPYGELPQRITDGSGWSNAYTNSLGKLITDYGNMAIQVARNRCVDFVDFSLSGWNTINKQYYINDDGGWLHPNEQGGKRLAALLARVFNDYI